MSNILVKHPTICLAEDIKDVCRPLNKLDITYFAHSHIDHAGNLSGISNNPEFLEHYVKNAYFHADIHHSKSVKFDHFVIWDAIELTGTSKKMNEEGKEFGVRHTFSIIETGLHGNDYYHFSTHLNDKSINQKYLDHLDLLKLFIFHFKDKINNAKELANGYNIKVSIDRKKNGFEVVNNMNFINDNLKQSFLRDINLSKFQTANDYSLSLREVEVLYWLHKGKSAPDVAKILGITNNTVNKHLANIKNKVGYHTQFQLGVFFSKLFEHSSDIIDSIFMNNKN